MNNINLFKKVSLKGALVLIALVMAQPGCAQSTSSPVDGPDTTEETEEPAPAIEHTGQNPAIWADVPDPSVIRVGDAYYMSSTTMHFTPGVPIMKSEDLKNWKIVNYAYDMLGETDALLLKDGENAYGEGTWASSLKYHNQMFYLATFSYTTQETYIFRTDDIESGSWETFIIDEVYHDPSLFFENDQAFLVYGVDDIKIIELTADATAIKQGGVDQILIPNSKKVTGAEKFIVPAEGAHLQKINGRYYVSLISWPAGSMRTQLIYRAERLLGTYSGKIVLQDAGVAQGGLVDTPDGHWYGFLFKDHGSVGRMPVLVPLVWENGWPVMGEAPDPISTNAKQQGIPGVVSSDEFDGEAGPDQYNDETSILSGLSLVWQWNHNPDPDQWSLDERPGYLRLTNAELDTSWVDTRNTLTQRTFAPQCTGTVVMDTQNMKDGDYSGLGGLQGTNGFVGVKKEGGETHLVMMKETPEQQQEIETLPLEQNEVHLRIAFNFENLTDKAHFFYSLDGESWQRIGEPLQMEYTLDHFVGYRYALFNYATRETGGSVDFDYFRIKPGLFTTNN